MICDDILVTVVDGLALSGQIACLVQHVCNSVVLKDMDDVTFFGEALEGQLKLMILVHSSLAKLTFATTAYKATAEASKCILSQVRAPIGSEFLSALNVLFKDILSGVLTAKQICEGGLPVSS